MKWLNYLLVFVPISIALKFLSPDNHTLLFVSACLAVLPLAGLMGHATDELAKHLGPNIGGLLNATFGNAAELIITIFALKAGLLDVVQASITGSIIGNILLVLGLALLVGGWKREKQVFNRTLGGMHSSMLLLAVVGLMLPAVFVHARPGLAHEHAETKVPEVWNLSLAVSAVLMLTYVLGLWFSLKTHTDAFGGPDETQSPHWTKRKALATLAVATAFVAWMSEMLVHSVEPMTHALGLSPIFVGVIVIPIIGNAAEHATAVVMAAEDKMDVALGIAIGSSTQIALFVAPLLVFLSALFGHHLSLIFTQVELVSVGLAVAVVALVAHDGETHWLEGAQLLLVYVIIALAFYLVPPEFAPATPATH
jgi:Ca2+:H+ antiporter